jgi:hypothetical protein
MPVRSSAKTRNLIFLWLWVWLLACGNSFGENVILYLKNGDRISGRLISQTTNEVVLATDYSQRLAIGANLIERREAVSSPSPSAPAIAHSSTNNPTRPSAPASGVVGELVLTNKPTMAQTAGGASKPKEPPKPPEPSQFRKFLDEWRGEAQLGANLGFSTKDRKAFTGLIKLAHTYSFSNDRALRNILDYDVSYGTTDNVLSDNRMDGTWKTEFDLNKRILLYNSTRAGYDETRGINFQYDVGPGVGYKWLVLSNFVFKTELGGDYSEQYFINKENTSRYSYRLAEDLWWQITPKIRWDEKAEFFPEVKNSANYRIRLETNLSYLLKQNLTLTLNVIDLYDTAVPDGVSKNDLQIRSLLGIKF